MVELLDSTPNEAFCLPMQWKNPLQHQKLHYISNFFSANCPQTCINKGSCHFATFESVEDGHNDLRDICAPLTLW
jgi:hypothetical protein